MCKGKHGRLILSIMKGEDYLAKCLSSSFTLMKSGYTRKVIWQAFVEECQIVNVISGK